MRAGHVVIISASIHAKLSTEHIDALLMHPMLQSQRLIHFVIANLRVFQFYLIKV
jgi:hypothetical protein